MAGTVRPFLHPCSAGALALQERRDLFGEFFKRLLAAQHLAIDEEGRRRIDLKDFVGEFLVGRDLVEQCLILQALFHLLLR